MSQWEAVVLGGAIAAGSALIVTVLSGRQRLKELRAEWDRREHLRVEELVARRREGAVDAISVAISFLSQIQMAVYSKAPDPAELERRFTSLRSHLVRIRVAEVSPELVEATWQFEQHLTFALYGLLLGEGKAQMNPRLSRAGAYADTIVEILRREAGLELAQPLPVRYEDIFGRSSDSPQF